MFPLASGGSGDAVMGDAPLAGSGGLAEAQDDLQQALGLAAAFFGGDAAAAEWAADGGGDLELPGHGSLGLGVPLAHHDAELDALMGLPAGPAPQLLPLLDLGGGGEAEGLAPPGAEGGPAAAHGSERSTAAAVAAAELAQSVQHIGLDDIDGEPADTLAPGGRRAGVPTPLHAPHHAAADAAP